MFLFYLFYSIKSTSDYAVKDVIKTIYLFLKWRVENQSQMESIEHYNRELDILIIKKKDFTRKRE